MIKEYINIFRKYSLIILTLGFAYGATIVFTFFGPILKSVSGEFASTLSIIAVVFHVLGFYLKPFKIEEGSKFFYVSLIILIPLVLLFGIMPYYLKIITTMLYAYMIGRVGCFWTHTANLVIPNPIRGKIISAALFISFLTLFFVNMSFHLLTGGVALVLPAAMSSISVVLYLKTEQKYKYNIVNLKGEARKIVPPYFIYVFLMVVYISGGFSYAGIYPSFEPYAHIDRYYNVLFFLIAIIIAGVVLDKYGRKIAFTLGVGFLGIAFTFFIMPSSVFTYFIVQTFLQSGWAFVNAFGWSFSWDMAEQSKKDILFPRGISAMLLGAAIGAFLAEIIEKLGFRNSSICGIVTFIPLFVAMIFLIFFPETLKVNKKRKINLKEFQEIEQLSVLTPRELEVCYHMFNGFSNERISKVLFISENTVKTHVGRIYSKLYVASRTELRGYIDKIISDYSFETL